MWSVTNETLLAGVESLVMEVIAAGIRLWSHCPGLFLLEMVTVIPVLRTSRRTTPVAFRRNSLLSNRPPPLKVAPFQKRLRQSLRPKSHHIASLIATTDDRTADGRGDEYCL